MRKIRVEPLPTGDWSHCFEAAQRVIVRGSRAGCLLFERDFQEPTGVEITLDFYTSVEDQTVVAEAIVEAAKADYGGSHLVLYSIYEV